MAKQSDPTKDEEVQDVVLQLEKLAASGRQRAASGRWRVMWIGIACVLAALVFPAHQAFLWLQTGVWTPFPISYAMQFIGWRIPTTDWVGLQKILTWIFDLPVLVVPAFLALVCFYDSGTA